jgi:beta-galactosidase
MKKTLILALALAAMAIQPSQAQRERIKLDEDWQFALGHAADPARDFGCATEYFNYFTKVNSMHNEGPYAPQFDASKWSNEWRTVRLPFDWVVDLPYAAEASHSHGYKTVGYRYPECSVGWYRKTFSVPAEDLGRHLHLEFDGIFRNAQVWVNGFYLGHEASGYATQVYDISEYLNYGGENSIAVRADASREEGWFYEGAGIYRHVWLVKADKLHVAPFGTFAHSALNAALDKAVVTIETTVDNQSLEPRNYRLRYTLLDAAGQEVGTATANGWGVEAKAQDVCQADITVEQPHLWSPDAPYLYKVRTEVETPDGQVVDEVVTPIGIRQIAFTPNEGFLLNGQPLKLRGVNMHQDHPGVGAAIPDALQAYRLRELKKLGVNAYRASHNPMTPEMLDACDSLGILVLEENRLPGVNEEHLRLLRRMIDRDRNHPSIILWSVGNEEWGIEWDVKGTRIAEALREYCHRYDPTRPMCMATSGGPTVVIPTDVAGYNYIHQNPIEEHRRQYPERCAVGSEETTGCGTRGIYYDDREHGHMASLNRAEHSDSLRSAIEYGWNYYNDRPWLGGLFYWTGFDYRGEPNPLAFPATGSEFGILDYCGFPKDEAYYLQSWWTATPTLHLLPHWTLRGHEGEAVNVWAYSNCDEVELFVNGKSAGRKAMPQNGHLEWDVTYQPGSLRAVGYKQGRKQLTEVVYTALTPAALTLTADRTTLRADDEDVAVCRVEVLDAKKHFVPDACEEVEITVSGPVRILGVGNGDPAYQADERPLDPEARTYHVRTFNGLAQVLIQSAKEAGQARVGVKMQGGKESVLTLNLQ